MRKRKSVTNFEKIRISIQIIENATFRYVCKKKHKKMSVHLIVLNLHFFREKKKPPNLIITMRFGYFAH